MKSQSAPSENDPNTPPLVIQDPPDSLIHMNPFSLSENSSSHPPKSFIPTGKKVNHNNNMIQCQMQNFDPSQKRSTRNQNVNYYGVLGETPIEPNGDYNEEFCMNL